ncbi:GAF domain-containing protein [Actinoplanes subtropicus]|uniref:GAF domain-containing protein n=1 Tax=Actinoplanes subtropicus TaxID=543632 RepID=UPI00068A7D66|nr:GAF domain-containing protein [Actinoplanes subtropicus]
MSPASDHRRSLLADPGRLEALRRHRILDCAPSAALDLVTEIAATVCGTPMATVSIVDADRVWFVAARGLGELRQVAADPGLCASALAADGLYLVTDAAVDPRARNHPLVSGGPGVRFYAGAPIIAAGGHRLGVVAALDTGPRQLTETQTTVLTQLAALVVEQLRPRPDEPRPIPRQPAATRPA